jgi:hypothetical protein
MPLGVRVIRDTGEEGNLDSITVLSLPPKTYPTGSVSFELAFDQPGKFVGLVTAGDKGQYSSRFPFSVASNRATYQRYLLFLAVIAGGVLLYIYSTKRGRSKAA